MAVATIAMSLFVGGTFLLLTNNLDRVLIEWRGRARIVVYLAPDAGAQDRARLDRLLDAPWVTGVTEVTATEARSRFEAVFPSMAELLGGLDEAPIPSSLEVAFAAGEADRHEFAQWVAGLRREPAVEMVDDDRDWLRQLEAVVAVLKGLGVVVGAALLGAAVFTIASVVRLTAYLYRDEIAVMRLVGATELYIRGPFYLEGLFQGLAGGLLATAALYGCFWLLDPGASTSLLGTVLVREFLSARHLAGLVALGAAAGLTGSIVSLRREAL